MIDKLSAFVSRELEEKSFEELLEAFDISPEEAFVSLFNNGMIDEELFDEMGGLDA